jgi:hypothetical protein
VTVDDAGFGLPAFRHLLIAFGGVAGLEKCVESDETIDLPGHRTSKTLTVLTDDDGVRAVPAFELAILAVIHQLLELMKGRTPTSAGC